MAKIISTVNTGKDENFEILSKNIKKSDGLINTDPMKTCMTRTIVPNKRPVEKEDVKKFVNRVKPDKETKNKENDNNKKAETNQETITVEKRKGRPKKN